jgi:hypothetical protein
MVEKALTSVWRTNVDEDENVAEIPLSKNSRPRLQGQNACFAGEFSP